MGTSLLPTKCSGNGLMSRFSYERVLTDLIPVPPRLLSVPPTDLKPLSGKRLAIQDIYDIRGVKTSMGCRSYEACYGECH